MRSSPKHTLLICVVGVALVVIVGLTAIGIGPLRVPPGVTARICARQIGIPIETTWTAQQEAVVSKVRMPRVAVAAFVGAALALSGTLMQGLFRNPMASPNVIGVSAGGAFGASVALALGLAERWLWAVPGAAFVGALLASFVVYRIATLHGHTPVATLLLAGIAVTAFLGAATSLVIVICAQKQGWHVPGRILFWTMGDLGARLWKHVWMVAPPVLFAVGGAMFFRRDLNLMLLGEEQAKSLGVSAHRLKLWLLTFAALATGAAVSVGGMIGFVGLVIPHILRMIVGPDHRQLIPASIFGGAAYVIVMDLICRVIVAPGEMRIGILTSAIGGPFFLYLILRNRRETMHL